MSTPVGSARTHPVHVYRGLKAAVRRLVRDLGGQEAAASLTRVDHQRLGRYGRVHEAMQAPIDVIADLETEAGCPAVTRLLAAAQGYLLVPRPGAAPVPLDAAALGRMANAAGDVIGDIGVALADGTVTVAEVHELALREDVRRAMEALAAIDAGLADLLAEAEE